MNRWDGKKVEELEKRVGLTDEELWNVEEPCIQGKPCPFGIADEPVCSADAKANDDKCTLCGMKAIAKAQLNKVLNDPDLALIDKKRGYPEGVFDYEQHRRIFEEANCLPVILLAEAMKEVEG